MYLSVYITCANKEEAGKIAEILVTEKLAACVNYFPVNSVYIWKGKLEKDSEYALLCKTRKENFNKIKKRVSEIHSYEVPAILAFEIVDGNEEFLKWIDDSVGIK
jgi:periplasmic divalent cation tolerance protein